MTLKEMDQTFVLPTYARTYVEFTHGVNATLFDKEGRDYIDLTSGIAVVSCGHGNKRLADALYDQAQKMIHISNLYAISPQALLAKKLVESSGYDMKIFFSNSGAEANEGAIKIARKYGEVQGEPKRYKIITLVHSFHGRTITALKATGQEKMHTYFGPFPDGFVYASCIEQIPELVDDHTVGVMIELVQGEGGVSAMDKKAVQDLALFLKSKDILLMVDEVQTGVYRTGEFLASNLYEITPDVITLAKGLGGGVPIGAVMTGLKDIFSPGDHGSTFGGNFLSTRAGLEVIDILTQEYDSGALNERMELLSTHLSAMVEKFPHLFEASVGLGLLRGLRAKSDEIQKKVVEKSFEEGVLILKAGLATIRFAPALTISKEEMDEGFLRFERALKQL